MKILITGASGFIGSFIVEEALRQGFDTWAAIRRSSSKEYLQEKELLTAECMKQIADIIDAYELLQ